MQDRKVLYVCPYIEARKHGVFQHKDTSFPEWAQHTRIQSLGVGHMALGMYHTICIIGPLQALCCAIRPASADHARGIVTLLHSSRVSITRN